MLKHIATLLALRQPLCFGSYLDLKIWKKIRKSKRWDHKLSIIFLLKLLPKSFIELLYLTKKMH